MVHFEILCVEVVYSFCCVYVITLLCLYPSSYLYYWHCVLLCMEAGHLTLRNGCVFLLCFNYYSTNTILHCVIT